MGPHQGSFFNATKGTVSRLSAAATRCRLVNKRVYPWGDEGGGKTNVLAASESAEDKFRVLTDWLLKTGV